MAVGFPRLSQTHIISIYVATHLEMPHARCGQPTCKHERQGKEGRETHFVGFLKCHHLHTNYSDAVQACCLYQS